uniref:Ribosomal RNA large subunit methyltransferase K/L n=1 Tax=Magnetococcus massalia (strain MO-1) TaxID=451514 RepID=A0A1S7LGY9_MAGMO|nr:Ribosomal RNA large subunit methyltransferase L [Candidatus Magnetococcus massalia]
MSHRYFATTAKGLEAALADELRAMGCKDVRAARAGVSFHGSLEIGLRACLWSRIANRILLFIKQLDASNGDSLYEGAKAIAWEDHITPEGSLAVDCVGTNDEIRHTHYGALRIKDAIVDRIRDRHNTRPSVDREFPDLRINLNIRGQRGTLAIDLTGEPLHRRGYRKETGKAPLKENLAAALLHYAGWQKIAADGGALLDPMAGSGTILIEAAMIAGDKAPGIFRRRFGFQRWVGFDTYARQLWTELGEEANQRMIDGEAHIPPIVGSDWDDSVVRYAQHNVEEAELEEKIIVHHRPLHHWPEELAKHPDWLRESGLLITNPPYGERVADASVIEKLYQRLGGLLTGPLDGWNAGFLLGDALWQGSLNLPAHPQRMDLYNGALACAYVLYTPGATAQPSEQAAEAEKSQPTIPPHAPSGEGAQMFANRLRKNLKRLKKWVKREEVECYRIYDADMPEYALALDRYGEWVVVQEYQAPRSIPQADAHRRFQDALSVIPSVLEVPVDRVIIKSRERQKGSNQYTKQGAAMEWHTVHEAGLKMRINLTDYLDTGLFLDHAPMRARMGAEAAGKRFLNLFCYTGAATVHAVAGGAAESLSIDLSNTYLSWLEDNLRVNQLEDKQRHKMLHADTLAWLAGEPQEAPFDLIFLDPPTFSNSKRMQETLDIQRDHVELITNTIKRLAPGGTLYFSTNRKKFKLDLERLEQTLAKRFGDPITIKEITKETLGPDFQRVPPIHMVWQLVRNSPK